LICTIGPAIARAISDSPRKGKGGIMLWTIFVILLVMWLLGMATSYTLGGFIHILLVLAIAAVLIRVIQGRSPV
jgi:asparagine N-glycosylation enzyme membrane subunit Stt3